MVRPWRLRLVIIGLCVVGAAALALVPAFVVRQVIDANLILSGGGGLALAAFLYLGAVAAAALLTAGYGYLAATVAQRALAELRGRLFEHLVALPTGYHDRTAVGDSISRTTVDIEAIDDLFSSSVPTLLGQTFGLVTSVAAMVVLSPLLSLSVVMVIPPILFVTRFFRRRVRGAERETRRAIGLANSELAEDLSAVEVIRGFGREAVFANRFRRTLLGWLQAANRSVFYGAFYTPILAMFAAVVTSALLWLGAQRSLDVLGLSLGTLIAFILVFGQFFTPLVNLGEEWQAVQAALAGAERVFAVLDIPTDATTVASRHPARANSASGSGFASEADAPASTGEADAPAIVLDRVTFGYTDGHPVLHEVSLAVRSGEHVAVIGRTGSGKSSILALLAGLYEPWSGSVELMGLDPRGLDGGQRRTALGFVPQGVTLFPGTVADNITLEDPSVPADAVEYAAQLAGADGFIGTLPDGFGTVLSDNERGAGVQLSAGQRQLLALARALVTRPQVLLLDEATAVVDGASDAAIRSALRTRVLPTGTAVLTVAHRLASAREADRVIVMAAGRIVEQGTPAQLLAAGGRFADLIALEEAGWAGSRDTLDVLD